MASAPSESKVDEPIVADGAHVRPDQPGYATPDLPGCATPRWIEQQTRE
jgi:hypothetical protein